MNAIPPKSENEKPKSEPKITQTRAPILATRLGRGRLGGSTICAGRTIGATGLHSSALAHAHWN